MGKGFAELESEESDGLGGKGGVFGARGGGGKGVEAAVELVGHKVAGDGDEQRVGLLLVSGAKAGLEQGWWRVDAPGAAGLLEVGEVCCLGGRWKTVEDGCPAGRGCGAEGVQLGGIVEGVEVDVGEEENWHGVGGSLGLRG